MKNLLTIPRMQRMFVAVLLLVMGFTFSESAAQCVTPPSGLVSWWPGDGDANDIEDGNNGSLVNGATFATGKVGQAFILDGTNDYVEIPDNPNLTPSSITLDAWVRPDVISGNPPIFSKYNSNNPSVNGVSWVLLMFASGQVRFVVYQDAAGNIARGIDTDNAVLNTGIWQHVAATFDLSTQEIKIYVNGIEVPSTLIPGASATITSIADSNTPVRIGTFVNSLGNFDAFWGGLIDEVDIYNRALSASEIHSIYNAGSAGKCTNTPPPVCVNPPSGLVSWWPGEDNANDIQSSNHGTLQNGATFAAGKVDQALSFDGVDDAALIADNASLRVSSFTLDAWINTADATLIQPIIAKVQTSENWISYMLRIQDGGKLALIVENKAENRYAHWRTLSTLSSNRWYHIAGTWQNLNGDNTDAKIYIDGVEQAIEMSLNNGYGSTFFLGYTSDPLYIGRDGQPSGRFVGLIDETDIYDRVLSAAEIQAIYNAGSAGKCTNQSMDEDNDGFTISAGDCDDANPNVFPGASEQCDALDNDCDRTIDEGPNCWPVAENCDALHHEVFTTEVPNPYAIAISPSEQYGNYMYVTSGQKTIYRVSPDGTAEVFAQGRSGNGNFLSLVFDNTPDHRYGGYLYAIVDYFGGPCYAGIDRILPDGTVESFVDGCGGNPVLLGAYDGEIDDQGKFGYNFFLADFEVDEFGRSPSTIIQISPAGGRSPFYSVFLRGVFGIDIDRFGNFGGDMLAANAGGLEWRQGDNSIYRVKPDGTHSVVVPDVGLGFPYDVLVDGLGSHSGNLFVLYSNMMVVFNQFGEELKRHSASGNRLVQDRWGNFNYDIFYSSSNNEIRRLICGQCLTPPSGLVSWWPGDDNANDIESSNHGTLQNGAMFAPGKVGQAFSFDGVDDYVSVPDNTDWDLSMNDFTIDFWVNFDQIKESMFIHQESGATFGGFEFDYQAHIGSLVFSWDGHGVFSRTWSPLTNRWYHLAVTRTSGAYRMYVDGAQLGSDQFDSNPIADVTGNLRIGSWSGGAHYTVDGRIDELDIFDRALSASEIQSIYNIGSAGKCKECTPPDVSITGPNPVCPNTTYTYTATTNTNDARFEWSVIGGTINGSNTGSSVSVTAGDASTMTVSVEVTDGATSCSNSVTLDVSVEDNEPPVIITFPTHVSLWPPNHQYETILVAHCVDTVGDNCTFLSPSDVMVDSVSSDEPEDANGGGDGNTLNDIVIASDCKSVQLRRERRGGGNGRVYTLYLSVRDGNGNIGAATCVVTVPHSQNGNPAVDNGPAYFVFGNCNSAPKAAENFGQINESETMPEGYALDQNYPNPFNPSTSIAFSVKDVGVVQLTIYNIHGQEVRALINGQMNAGFHSVNWDGKDERGQIMPSGVYLYKLRVNGFAQTRKMIFMK